MNEGLHDISDDLQLGAGLSRAKRGRGEDQRDEDRQCGDQSEVRKGVQRQSRRGIRSSLGEKIKGISEAVLTSIRRRPFVRGVFDLPLSFDTRYIWLI